MPSDPKIPSSRDHPQADSMVPPLPPSEPPVMLSPPPLVVVSTPPGLPKQNRKSSPLRQLLAILLSLCLGLFLADAVVSLLDDSLILFFDVRLLTAIRGIVFFFAMLMAAVIYGLMGVTPVIPKRLFLPVTLFNPLALLVAIPLFIHFYDRTQQVACVLSFCQVLFG